jgi:thiol-disulfide isomerase/thioredoxin
LDVKGKVVLLNAWASWRGACREELPRFQKLYEQFGYDSTEKWEQGMSGAIEKNKPQGETACAAQSPGQ